MQVSYLLEGNKLKEFCEEMNIKSNPLKILIKVNDDKAEYYNFDDNKLLELDILIAKKYI